MKSYFPITILVTLFLSQIPKWTSAQITAVTEFGDTIYVYDNGQWTFSPDAITDSDNELDYLNIPLVIDTLKQEFFVDKLSKKEAKSRMGFFKILYNDKKWDRIPPAQLGNNEAEMAFISKEKNIYCLVIAEEIEIGGANIFKIAVNSLEKKTGAKTNIIKVEQRTVNGEEVLIGLYDVELSGLKMKFDAYYYSTSEGTVQFVTWTGMNLWEKKKDEIETFLNGLIKL